MDNIKGSGVLCIIFILLCFINTRAQSTDTLRFFEKQQIVYTLADSVNIRSTAGSAGELLMQLPIGTRLKILGESPVASRINNLMMPWYLVSFGNNQKGYIWGGKMALSSLRSNKNPEYTFHFGLEKADKNVDAIFQIRIEKNNQELQRISFEGFGMASKRHTFTNVSNKGLDNVDDILQVDGYAESCGGFAGAKVFFWSNGKLHLVETLPDIGDGEFFETTYFIYPSDMEGKPGIIIRKDEEGEHLFEKEQKTASWNSPNIRYDKNSTTKYRWDGEKLIKLK